MRLTASTKQALSGCAVFLATLVFFANNFAYTRSWVFQERDLRRAGELLQGHLFFFGPETTGGGHLFGPLYYFMLAIPALMGSPWFGAWCEMIALSALSAALIWYFLCRNANATAATIGVILFLMADWHLKVMWAFYNPSYLPLFQTVVALALGRAFMNEKADAKAWFIAMLFVGLGCQVHGSILIMVFAGVALQLLAPRLGLARIPWRGFLIGFAGVLLPILPYLIWSIGRGEISGRHLPAGSVIDALIAMKVLVLQTPSEGTMPKYFMALFFSLLNIPALLFVLPLNRYFAKEGGSPQVTRLIKIFAVQAAVTYPLVIYYALASNAHRYQGPFAVSIAILGALLIERHLTSPRRLWYLMGCASALIALLFAIYPSAWLQNTSVMTTIIFILIVMGVAYCAEEFPWRARLMPLFVFLLFILAVAQSNTVSTFGFAAQGTRSPLGRIQQYLGISAAIYSMTGWDFSEARRRIFFINPHVEQSMAYAYDDVMTRVALPDDKNPPAGFLASTDIPKALADGSAENYEQWILRQNIPNDVKRWLESGDLKLEAPVEIPGNAVVIPYRVSLANGVPLFIQNVGYAYSKYPGFEKIENFSEPRGVSVHGNSEVIFRWNECPEHQPECTTGAVVNIFNVKGGGYRIQVAILGQPLSHLSEWISPRWTEEWNRPFLQVRCGKRTEHFVLAEAIGRGSKYTTREHGNMIIKSNSLLAPYETGLNIHCEAPISEIAMGRESSTITDTNLAAPYLIQVPTLRAELNSK